MDRPVRAIGDARDRGEIAAVEGSHERGTGRLALAARDDIDPREAREDRILDRLRADAAKDDGQIGRRALRASAARSVKGRRFAMHERPTTAPDP